MNRRSVSLTLPVAAWACLRGWPGLQKTLHRGCHSVTASIPQKVTAGKQAQTPTDSLQGRAYTLATFKELKLIVSGNRDKSARNLPA